MAVPDDLERLNAGIGRSISGKALERVASSIENDEHALAIAHVSKVKIDGVSLSVYPQPIGIFESPSCPVVLLTNRHLQVALIGTQRISDELPLVDEIFERFNIADIRKTERKGRYRHIIARANGSAITLQMAYLSTWKNVRGTARLVDTLAALLVSD
jgi:hypothetical protein